MNRIIPSHLRPPMASVGHRAVDLRRCTSPSSSDAGDQPGSRGAALTSWSSNGPLPLRQATDPRTQVPPLRLGMPQIAANFRQEKQVPWLPADPQLSGHPNQKDHQCVT
jgi:hypothetical protein